MPPSARDLTSIKSRFSPLTISPSFPRIVPVMCPGPCCPGAPCPTSSGISLPYFSLEYLSPLLLNRPLPRPLSLKMLILLTTSSLPRAPGSRPYSSEEADKSGSGILHVLQLCVPARPWLWNFKSLIFDLQQTLLWNSSLLRVSKSILKRKKKKNFFPKN